MTDIFEFEQKPLKFAVMGNPIKHSKSPQIHQQFAQLTHKSIEYEAIHVDLGGLTQAVRNFQASDGKGLNITVPFKIEAFKLADTLTERARLAGAVNTLLFSNDGQITGDNTDGFGLVYDILEHLQWTIEKKKIAVLGAGGAARGILGPLLAKKPSAIFIANRTASKAKALADDFSTYGTISGGGFSELENNQFDILINATSASISGDLPPLPDNLLKPDSQCYDLMYAKEDTRFIDWAKNHGCLHVSDGLGMLVGQAAESYYQWLNVRPEIKPVIQFIRQQM